LVVNGAEDEACTAPARHGAQAEPIGRNAMDKRTSAPTVHRLVTEKIVEPELLDHAARKPAEDRLVVLVAGIAAASQTAYYSR
jgi:hypothetical protein